MNNKITIQSFASLMATKADVDQPMAQTFIKSLFAIVAEELHKGEPVTVKGIGTFSLSHEPGKPVAFEPANILAETVNAPFAMFQPEILADDMTDEMITEDLQPKEEAIEPQTQPAEEPAVAVTTPAAVAEIATVAIPAEVPEPAPISEEPAESVAAIEKENAESIPAAVAEAPVEETVIEESAIAIPAIPEPADTKPDEDAPRQVYPMPPIPVKQELPPPYTPPVSTPVHSNPADQWPATDCLPEDTELYAEDAAEAKPSRARRFFYGLIIGLVIGLAVAALLLVAYTALT